MKAGALRHVIDIEQKTGDISDGFGNTTQVWTKLYTNIPAEIKTATAAETFTGDETQSQTALIINTRYLPYIDSTKRITLDGRIFNILGINNILERNIQLTFQVKEVIAAQPLYSLKTQTGRAAIEAA